MVIELKKIMILNNYVDNHFCKVWYIDFDFYQLIIHNFFVKWLIMISIKF